MNDPSSGSTSRQNGGAVFQELVNKLKRFVLMDDIHLGQIKGFGGFAEVYEADMRVSTSEEMKKVAVKRFRVILSRETEFAKSFKREILIWNGLEHENVLRLLGVTTIDGVPCTVSEWMENGTLETYLEFHTDVDSLELIDGIACGLEYLHMNGVVHSDLKSDNVLISQDGHPVLSDFGNSRLLMDSITIAGSTTLRGNVRWMAPELIQVPSDSPNQMHTKASDVWAFGMVAYHALGGRIPYHEIRNEVQVLMAIVSRQLPTEPNKPLFQISRRRLEMLWRCCCECWRYDSSIRPTITEVRTRLEIVQRGTSATNLSHPAVSGTGQRLEIISQISNSTLEADTPHNQNSESLFAFQDTIKVSPGSFVLSPTGRFLAMIAADGASISFLDSRTMSLCRSDFVTESKVVSVVWSSTEDYFVISTFGGMLQKWCNIVEAPTLVAQSSHSHLQTKLEFSSDDKLIVLFNHNMVKLLDASNLSSLWESSGYWDSVAIHPTGHRVFLIQGYSILDVNIQDPDDIKTTERWFNFSINRLSFDKTENTCVVDTNEGVYVLGADTLAPKFSLPFNDLQTMQLTPNGECMLLVSKTKKVVLWDIAAGQVAGELTLDAPFDGAWDVDISKSCRLLHFYDNNTSYLAHLTSTLY